MNARIFAVLLLVLGISIVRGFLCNMCQFHVYGICFNSAGTVECSSPRQCTTTTACLGSQLLFEMLECKDNCVNVTNGFNAIFGLNYITSCCSSDRCNSPSAANSANPCNLATG